MIVPYPEILIYTGLDPSAELEMVHAGAEAAIVKELLWDPEETNHVNKLYDGESKSGAVPHLIGEWKSTEGLGKTDLWLDEKYVSTVIRVSERTPAIKFKNTNTNSTTAYVTVDPANDLITLVRDGTSETVSLTTYTTIATAVAAISALSGWNAEVYHSDYNTILSSNLLEAHGQQAGGWMTSEPAWQYLDMAGKPYRQIELYDDPARIYYAYGFPAGRKRICVSYTSGWDADSMPDYLKDAVRILTKANYAYFLEGDSNIAEYSLGHLRVKYKENTQIALVITMITPYIMKVIV